MQVQVKHWKLILAKELTCEFGKWKCHLLLTTETVLTSVWTFWVDIEGLSIKFESSFWQRYWLTCEFREWTCKLLPTTEKVLTPDYTFWVDTLKGYVKLALHGKILGNYQNWHLQILKIDLRILANYLLTLGIIFISFGLN